MTGTPQAICHRCGAEKRGPFVPCKGCQHQPRGEGRAVAWLFSRAWLDAGELDDARQRLLDGHRPDVPRHLIAHARAAMGALPHDPATQPLHIWALLGLSAANLLLTPLAGMAIWHGLRDDRPVAARQSLQITLPVAVGLTLFWMSLLLNQLVS